MRDALEVFLRGSVPRGLRSEWIRRLQPLCATHYPHGRGKVIEKVAFRNEVPVKGAGMETSIITPLRLDPSVVDMTAICWAAVGLAP